MTRSVEEPFYRAPGSRRTETPPVFAIGDRAEWGPEVNGSTCRCVGHRSKHRASVVTVVSVPVHRPGGVITYAVSTDDGIAVADARYLRRIEVKA